MSDSRHLSKRYWIASRTVEGTTVLDAAVTQASVSEAPPTTM